MRVRLVLIAAALASGCGGGDVEPSKASKPERANTDSSVDVTRWRNVHSRAERDIVPALDAMQAAMTAATPAERAAQVDMALDAIEEASTAFDADVARFEDAAHEASADAAEADELRRRGFDELEDAAVFLERMVATYTPERGAEANDRMDTAVATITEAGELAESVR